MLRNLSRTLLIAGAAWLAAASALSAQTGTEAVRGDVDGDGQVTVTDARIVSDYLVGRQVPAGVNVAERGDVNGDGKVTSVDAAIIRASAAGRDVSRFKVGAPVGPLPENTYAWMECSADVRAGSVHCGAPDDGSGGPRATELYVGGPNGTYVKLKSFNVVVDTAGDGSKDFKFDVTVENRLAQSLGTNELDGVTPDPAGVRVFFETPPTPNGIGDSGGIQVLGTPPPETFHNSLRSYYPYAGPLAPGDTSEAVQWHFKLDPGVSNFKFDVYVWARGLPGWVDITPPAHAPSPYLVPVNYLAPGDSVDVTGTVRNSFGVALGTPIANWTRSNTTVASVLSTGTHTARIKALAEGVDTITASSHPPTSVSSVDRVGHTEVRVTYGDSALSTITASPGSVTVGGNSTVTLQVKFPDSTNVTRGDAPVTLTASPGGALSFVDHHDGTYTANLTTNTAGFVTVSGTLNGHTLVDTAVVEFKAAGLDHFTVQAPGDVPIPNQLVNSAFNVKVTARDAFNNIVTNYGGTVTFSTTPTDHVTGGNPSAAFTSGVLSSHPVTIGATGDYTALVVKDNVDNTKTGASNAFQVEAPPTAVADSPSAASTPGQPYHASFEQPFTVLAASGLLSNDTRGHPLAWVTSFGGDSLTGTVTTYPDGTTVTPLPGHTSGSLKVDSAGGVEFTPPTGFTGLYTFSYRIHNDRGDSDAKVTFAVGARPVANSETYPNTVLGNVPINTANGTSFSVATNDAGDAKKLVLQGVPTGGTVKLDSLTGTFTFLPTPGFTGAASFTYTVRNGFGTAPATATVTMNVSGIAWFVNANVAVNGNGRADSAFKDLTSALAVAQANQPIFLFSSATGYSGGTLAANQRLIGQGATTGSFGTLMGVTWPVHATVAEPAVGAPNANPTVVSGLTLGSGNTLRGFNLNGAGTLTGNSFGTLTVSEVGVNSSGQALNLTTGTISGSFSGVTSSGGTNNVSLSGVTLSGAVGLGSGALSGATAGNGLLLNNVTSATASDVLSYGGTIGNASANAAVQITNGSPRLSLTGNVSQTGAGPALALSGGSSIATLSGSLGTSGAGAVVSVSGGHTGTLTLTGSVSVSTGTGLQFDNADGTYDFSGVSALTLNGGDAAIDVLNGSGGTFSFPLVSQITNPTGEAIRINASSPSFTYLGRIDKTNGSTGITVSSNTGGSISFGSRLKKITSTGSNVAVNLTSNGSATITSADSLQIISATGNGFNATGGGTVTVGGTQNTINSSGGIALNVLNTAIGGGVLNFKSISASGGSGIALNNTSGGGLTVAGDGASDAANTSRGRTTAKSGGGTLTLGSGGTISGASGTAVSLTSAGAVTLRNMVIANGSSDAVNANSVTSLTMDNDSVTGHANGHGIRGNSLSGLTLTHSSVWNNATAAGLDATDTWNLRFTGLTGTATVQNSKISNSLETVFGIINTSGSLTLNISNTNITDTYPSGGSVSVAPGTNGLQINAYGSSVINATLTNDSIARTRARGVTASTETAGSGSLSLTVTGTKFADNVTGGLEIAHGSSGTATYNFNNNDFQRHGSIPINVNRLGSSTFSGFGDFTGTIQNNTIGSAAANSGTTGSADAIHVESNGTGGNTRVAIASNTIQQYGQHGIYLAVVDTKIGGSTRPNLEARVQGNSVTNPKANAIDGLRVVPGAIGGDDGKICLDVISNTLTGGTVAPAWGWRIRTTVPLSGTSPTPTISLKGWNGTDAFATYAVNRPNTLSGVSGTATESHGSGSLVAVASCNTP